MKHKLTYFAPVLIFLGVLGWIFAAVSAKAMLTAWWRLPLVGLIVGVCLTRGGAPGLWRKYTGWKSELLTRPLGILVASGIAVAALIGLNMIHAPGAEHELRRCAIVRLYKTTHQHQRRVGRHFAPTGSVYYRYHAEVMVEPEGITADYPLTLSRYRKLHRGDTLTFDVHHGLLGSDYLLPARK